jgi:hypothetical protein
MVIPLGTHTRTALEVPRWALGFYLRHFAVVAGISLVPSAQRFVAQLTVLPEPVGIALEVLTMGARLLLVGVIVWLAFAKDTTISGLNSAERWMRCKAFHRTQWPSLVIQLGLIGVAVLVFDVLPDQFIAPLVPEDSRRIYWAVLLGVKNPTIIAFTLVWIVGIFRQAMSYEPGNAQQEDRVREAPALNAK